MQILTYIDSNLAMQDANPVFDWNKTQRRKTFKMPHLKRNQPIIMEAVEKVKAAPVQKTVERTFEREEKKENRSKVWSDVLPSIKSILASHKIAILGFFGFYALILVTAFALTNVILPIRSIHLQTITDMEYVILDAALRSFALSSDQNDSVNDEGDLEYSSAKLKYALQSVTFSKYTVRSGDNITKIARRFGLSNISSIISVNKITNDRSLRIGEVIRIPSTDGIIHTVRKNESLASISKKYDLTPEALLDVNDLSSSVLQVGQEIFIPGAKLDPNVIKQTLGKMFMTPIKAKWRLSSPYGERSDPFTGVKKFHTGMDMACPTGTPVYSTMDGRVIEVSFNRIFGNYIIVSHANGYQSLYAHLSATNVKKGQYVYQGNKIGLVGSTGYSTGPHLHFTVYKNGKLVNPQKLLNNK
ncbi:MAG: M23 family metallopeptidase [Treponemataceae bacterium]|nr:M23 family metallopeptidase [Treponemataceae bacterium]